MNERIMNIRKSLKLTQEEFAETLGLTRNFIWKLEKGERIPSERTIADICRTFHISLEWLKTGNGEMFSQAEDSVINALTQTYNLNDRDKQIIKSYLALTPQEREVFIKIVKSMVN